MVNIVKAVFGGMMLFLGRDMEWLFSIGLGLLVGLQVSPVLGADTPLWMTLLLIVAVGAIGALPYLVYPDSRFIVTGFLAGGYVLSVYGSNVTNAFLGFELAGPTWLIFFVGAVIGAVAIGLSKEWGVMFATALAGAFLVTDILNTTQLAGALIAAGLFIVGCLVQAVIMRYERYSK